MCLVECRRITTCIIIHVKSWTHIIKRGVEKFQIDKYFFIADSRGQTICGEIALILRHRSFKLATIHHLRKTSEKIYSVKKKRKKWNRKKTDNHLLNYMILSTYKFMRAYHPLWVQFLIKLLAKRRGQVYYIYIAIIMWAILMKKKK